MRTTHARPDSVMKRARRPSCSEMPSVASTTRRQTSERRPALSERRTISSSTPLLTRAARRTPAVSTKMNLVPWLRTSWSMASRVVPDSSHTIARSVPVSRLSREDLPTFGRPRIATRSSSSASPPSLSALSGGSGLTSSSITSPMPVPCSPLTGHGVPRPRDQKSAAWSSPSTVDSHLFTASTTGTFCRRRKAAICSSSTVRPDLPSTTTSTEEASDMAIMACWRICGRNTSCSSSSYTIPPVSTTVNSWPFQNPSPYVRSRVTPGSLKTRPPEANFLVRRLAIVDFPTFGRPTTAMVGFLRRRDDEPVWRV
mmetsp:Transcript_54303/g.140223  ORF Transcript_54303/g.140223 Transcript_54303/m.140223 type:complete len:313 (+) Transcript_54303:809-1747(+)